MTSSSDRAAAAELARRIKASLVDPSKVDEAHQAPGDKSPGYADALMAEAPISVERAVHVDAADWDLIAKALEQFAAGADD